MNYLKLTILSFFIFFVFVVNFRKGKLVKFDFFSYFTIFFVLSYCAPLILWFIYRGDDVWFGYRFGLDSGGSWWVIGSLATAFFAVFLGYVYSSGKKTKIRVEMRGRKVVFKWLFIYTALYLLLLVVSVYSKGGVSGYIVDGIFSREAGGDSSFSAYASYFLVGGDLIVVLWLGFIRSAESKLWPIFFSAITFFAVIVVALSTGSRAAIIYPVLFVFIYFNGVAQKRVNYKSHFVFVILIIISVYSVGAGGKLYYGYARYGILDFSESFDFGDELLGVFAYYKHYLITIDQSISNPAVYQFPRLWIDYPRAVLDALPGYSWSDGSLDMFGYTSIIAELNKNHLYGNGYVPPGWIAGALINGWFIGVFLQGFLAGWVGGKMNCLMFKFKDSGSEKYIFAVAILLMTVWHRIFFAQDPWQIFLANFGLYCLLFFVLKTVSIRKIIS